MAKYVNTFSVTDHLTGEILEDTRSIFSVEKLNKEPAYVKMYISDLGAWQGLSKTESDVLYQIASTVDYEGIIQVTTFTKNKIVKRLGIANSTFANAMSKLVSKLIIQRVDGMRQVFTLNPYLFGKGDWKDIIEQRKAFVIQFTKAYGMEIPKDINPISFLAVQESLEARGQRRLEID
jgi:hypothetical protein